MAIAVRDARRALRLLRSFQTERAENIVISDPDGRELSMEQLEALAAEEAGAAPTASTPIESPDAQGEDPR